MMSFITDEFAPLAGNMMLAGQIGLNNLRQAAADRATDNTGAAWIRHLTAELRQRNAVIVKLQAELADERSGRLQAQSALRKLVRR